MLMKKGRRRGGGEMGSRLGPHGEEYVCGASGCAQAL